MTRLGLVVGMLLTAAVPAQELTVAVSANFQYAMADIATEFHRRTGITVKTVMGSSGKLTAQIRSGAPFDLFLSADTEYPDTLFAGGLTALPPRVYAHGALIIWTMRDTGDPPTAQWLLSDAVERIAIANPRTAPYGREAVRLLQTLGIYELVAARLVYGHSISQVNQYVLLGAVDAGITARSAMFATPLAGKGRYTEPDSTAYHPIAQAAVLLRHGAQRDPEATRLFWDFLFSPPARAILQKNGYLLP